MILPALPVESDLPYDFTIVGSGFAGLYLAEQLEAAGLRTLVIEQGPLDTPLNEGDPYYEIDVAGLDYAPLGERLAAFGGTSGHWAGMSRPLAPTVFEPRPYLNCPGWPITHDAFAAHLDAAKQWLRYTFGPSDPAYADPREGFLPGPTEHLTAHDFVAAFPQRRLNTERQAWARDSSLVDVLPAHRVIDLDLDAGGARLASVHVVHTDTGRGQALPVRQTILATGGIENARLMLSSGRRLAPGNPLSGRYGRTGKGFMEHPKFKALEVYIDETFPLDETVWFPVTEGLSRLRAYSLDEPLFAALELPRFAVFFWAQASDEVDVPEELRALDLAVHGREKTYRLCMPNIAVEQTPRDRSRIELSDRTDRHGQPLARMHWVLEEDQLRAYWRTFGIVASLMSQCGSVRARLVHASLDDFLDGYEVLYQRHHMGTTAMSHDARSGVVDTDCRVHGLDNLYVAGSSVFPTSDYVNPTLNLLALADRLAQHLTQRAATGSIIEVDTGQ